MMLRLLIIALTAFNLLAQSGGSMLTGTVQDSTGARIPKARVTIVNEESGVSAATETNDSGIYHSASLIPGTYRVEVEAGGFQRLLRRGIVTSVCAGWMQRRHKVRRGRLEKRCFPNWPRSSPTMRLMHQRWRRPTSERLLMRYCRLLRASLSVRRKRI